MALCRVCLVSDIRLLDLSKYHLDIYQRLTDTELKTETEHGMPSTVCYVCHRQLQKFQKFSEMACKSNRILQDLLHNDTEVANNALKGLVKQPLNVLLNLTVMPTMHCSISDFTNASSTPVAVKDEHILKDDAEETLENDKFEFQELEPLRDEEVNNDSNETDNSQDSIVKSDRNCFCCDVCNQMFYIKEDLVQHLKIYTSLKANSCKICDKRFPTSSKLKIHMQIHNKPYSCQICGKTYTQNGNLTIHMRIHTGAKPYSCTHCDKTFTASTQLKIHMRIHTGDRPYSCTSCDKTFTTSSNLNMHMRIHTGDKPHCCQRCGKTFSWRCSFTKHMRIHTG